MTTQSQLPLKWYVPFAENAASANFTELPLTSSDPTRASQSLGFPPLTMLPPESNGVPPEGPDFNGGMNQIARIAWWMMNGGLFTYDPVFAAQANILGYPHGAVLLRSDLAGLWLNLADNNQVNPDTATGAVGTSNWAPLASPYGSLIMAGLAGGTVTLTYPQAAFDRLYFSGTLAANQVIAVPNWKKRWVIVNNTTGAFTLTIQPAGGTAVIVPQNGAETPVLCDGTNCALPAMNVTPAATGTQPVQKQQKTLNAPFTSSGSIIVPAGVTLSIIDGCAGGGGGGGGASGTSATGSGGGGGGAGQPVVRQVVTVQPGETLTVTIGAAGTAGAVLTNGGNGGNTTIVGSVSGTLVSLTGGTGATHGVNVLNQAGGGIGGMGYPQGSDGSDTASSSSGASGGGGAGASGPFGGGGGGGRGGATAGLPGHPAYGYGAGGGGGGGYYLSGTGAGAAGAAAAPGFASIQW